jgi:hypothetical protein
MKKLLKSAIVIAGLSGAACAISGPASAASFAINFGDVAFGYSDGWYDHHHRWHRWHDWREARYYRDHYRHHYYGWRHDDRRHHHHRHHYWRH